MVEVFVLTLFELPKMGKREVRNVIRDQFLCRIAFHGKEYPYIAPFQYTLVENSLYFHFTNYGKKMRLLKRDNRVSVEIEKYKPDLSEYRFVVMRGMLRVVTNSEERKRAIRKMAREGKRKLSTDFLYAHGFHQHQSWSSFSPEKPMVIVKLEDVEEVIGLRNP
jgi:nitroimidazol reductase NimA-like FMN-containing flavoprotein (pyridoxamine 5'-phosphate oxidase superfamily)